MAETIHCIIAWKFEHNLSLGIDTHPFVVNSIVGDRGSWSSLSYPRAVVEEIIDMAVWARQDLLSLRINQAIFVGSRFLADLNEFGMACLSNDEILVRGYAFTIAVEEFPLAIDCFFDWNDISNIISRFFIANPLSRLVLP